MNIDTPYNEVEIEMRASGVNIERYNNVSTGPNPMYLLLNDFINAKGSYKALLLAYAYNSYSVKTVQFHMARNLNEIKRYSANDYKLRAA